MQNRMFSVIVPLYKGNHATLDRFLLHLKEQDYANWELIFVDNTPAGEKGGLAFTKSPAGRKLLKQVAGKWQLIEIGNVPGIGNGNHCRAFNEGATAAKGDYLLFLDPDVYLYPGTLREYKDTFEAHPEASFVYGHYDFENAGRVQGRTYSRYELRCANYVSGAFPIRREAFKGWDPTLESLQDWDMWLSAVDAGATGLFIDRPCFVTDPPSATGISANSAANWEQRWEQVRRKHGFPPSSTVVTSLGAPYHATKVAEVLGADSRVLSTLPNFKPTKYQSTYLLGFYPTSWSEHMKLFYQLGDLSKPLQGTKRVIHWIGTDIYMMQHSLSWMAWQNIRGILTDPEFGFVHLSECQATHDELLELGIPTEIVPLPAKIYPTCPLPESFTVGVYTNPTQDMYHEEFMYEVADAMPDIRFKFFGTNGVARVDGNKEWVGWVDMATFLPTISAVVRLTKHDGLPLGPVEAMAAGRNALTSQPLEHALTATYVGGEPEKAAIVEQIRQLQAMPLNVAGSEYWTRELDPELYKQRMSAYL